MDEKRRPPRIETDLRFISCSPGISIDSRIANISATGAFIETSEPMPIDAELDLHLQLPDDPEVISIDACVVWTKAMGCAALAGMGIQFKNILPKHHEKLAAFIAYNLQSDNGNRHSTLYA